MNIEREERDAKERNTLELLTDVKKKWHDREEAKIQKLRKDIEAANVVVQVRLYSEFDRHINLSLTNHSRQLFI